ncbi:hypothetical protein ACHAPT_002922 [Fusarium lateritium]
MDLWESPRDKKTLKKDLFLDCMEKHWNNWAAEKLSPKEKQAWNQMIGRIYTNNIKALEDLLTPSTWAEITSCKVHFPKEFFRSRKAAMAQIEFPQADLAEWEPNTNGPTTLPEFQKNIFIKQKMLGEQFRQATELSKRPWSYEPAENAGPAAKKPRKEAPDNFGLGGEIEGPLISKPNDVTKVFTNMEKQLASVRAAVEANTGIHQQAIDALRQSHEKELKKIWRYTDDTLKSVRESHRREIEDVKKAHEEELAKVHSTYKGAISTLNKAYLEGFSTLENARREVNKVYGDGAE